MRIQLWVFPNRQGCIQGLKHLWDNPEKTVPPLTIAEFPGAVERLRELPKLWERDAWGPDVIFKAFDDLDLVIFGGSLRTFCKLHWATEEELEIVDPGQDLRGITLHTLDFAKETEVPEHIHVDDCFGLRCDIYLNSTALFLYPVMDFEKQRWESMWGTLLHEMVHAFLSINVRKGVPTGGHGLSFQRCIRAVNRRIGERGLNLGIEATYEGEWGVNKEEDVIWKSIDDIDDEEKEEEAGKAVARME